jgi:hypothetical protein
MLGIILIGSYLLLVQLNQTGTNVENQTDATSQAPTLSPTNETSTEASNETNIIATNSFTPAIPEFTLKLVNHSFDIPTTYSIDPFTGENKTIQGNHWEWTTLDITITNQKFSGITNYSSLSYSGLMFNVRFKGHYSQDWTNISATSTLGGESGAGLYLPQHSNASYTVFSLMVNPFDLSEITASRPNVTLPYKDYPNGGIQVPIGGEVDFQVEAMFGTSSRNPTIPFSGWKFYGEESGWSETQTNTIP